MPDEEREFNQEQYDRLLASVADKNGCKTWNEWRKENPDIEIKLKGANLQRVFLDFANLQKADLSEANLQKASLSTDLRKADLTGANLVGADFSGAGLQEAIMAFSNLYGADLAFTDITSANFSGTIYSKALRLPHSANSMFLRLLNCWHTGELVKLVIYVTLLISFLLTPYFAGYRLKPCSSLFCGFMAFWPLLMVPFLAIYGWLFPLEKAIKETPDYLPKFSRLATIIMFPTKWRGAVVENIGVCSPLDLRYIKDQSYLEEMTEGARTWWKKFWMFLWGISSGYGDNIWLWILWSVILAFSFGAAYSLGGTEIVKLGEEAGRSPNWYTPFYFSIVTFTTLGFGDVTPTTLAGEILVTAEVILGYVMLGGLISIFANKLARRA